MAEIDCTEKLLVFYIYLIFVVSYLSILATVVVFITTYWFSIFLILYLPLNWVYHMVATKDIGDNAQVPETLS